MACLQLTGFLGIFGQQKNGDTHVHQQNKKVDQHVDDSREDDITGPKMKNESPLVTNLKWRSSHRSNGKTKAQQKKAQQKLLFRNQEPH